MGKKRDYSLSNAKRRELEGQRLKNGLCRMCGLEIDDKKYKSCDSCLSKKRIEARERCELRRSVDLCEKCGLNKPEEGAFKCRKCLNYHRRRNMKVRDEVFAAYGGYKCACCGEDNKWFMQIDHINNDGESHRNSIGVGLGSCFYEWLKKNNYPDGFQVLCGNCNFAKGKYGTCPHTWDSCDVELPPQAIRSGKKGQRNTGKKRVLE